MQRNEILEKVQDVFRDVFDDEELIIYEDTSSHDIEDWDSLTNVQLVVAIEHELGIRFTSAEIPSWSNVGDMMNSIEKKL